MQHASLHRRLLTIVAALATLPAAAHVALGEAAGEIHLPPGFRAELVYSVPLDKQGSWVCLTVDDRGRLITSDQYGGLYRIEPSPLGAKPDQTKVEPISISAGMAQGLLVVDRKLYVVINGQMGAFSSGLYRLSDTNGDDRFDRFEQLRVFQGDGEHGPHAVVLGPDRKSLYIVAGNYTGLPSFTRSLVPQHWGEDQLLPRIYDPNGHANELHAPAGWIARTDLNGNNLEIVSTGYRNAYDLAFNADGELLTFDSDMEWDIGTPWYRPTRVCHAVSGSDWGWRSGNGPWPPYYPDTLPPVVDVGPGSPTGLAFGTGTKFPPKYQQALFAGDWSYGNIYAVHLAPQGASYRGEVERFASAMPLGVTDMVVRPQDGALYFTVGGRKSESALYRIVATGDAVSAAEQAVAAPSPPPLDATTLKTFAAARAQRQTLENLHTGPQAGAVEQAWPQLSNPDRFIRYAARTAIEQQPVAEWRKRALAEPNPKARVQALVALARCGTADDKTAWIASLGQLKFADAALDDRLDILRAAALAVIRFEIHDPASRAALLSMFDSQYPTGEYRVDRELAPLLIRLEAKGIVARLIGVLDRAVTPEEGIDAAIALSAAGGAWTSAQRVHVLDWFDAAPARAGGNSYFGYLAAARSRFIDSFPAADRSALAARLSKPYVKDAPQPAAPPRPFVREWKLADVVALAESDAGKRDLENGRRMFAAANCYACHRVAGEGSSIGPDLTTVGRRFGVRDILQSIVEPSHAISDQYQQMEFETNGKTIVGRVTNIQGDKVTVSTNMLDPMMETSIRRDDMDSQSPSKVSVMPEGLLNTLDEGEILDLLAFLRAGGAAGTASK